MVARFLFPSHLHGHTVVRNQCDLCCSSSTTVVSGFKQTGRTKRTKIYDFWGQEASVCRHNRAFAVWVGPFPR